MGSVFSAIGHGISVVLSAIATAFVTTFEFMMDVITGIVCCRGFAGTRQAPPPPGKKNRKGMGMGIGASGFSAGVY